MSRDNCTWEYFRADCIEEGRVICVHSPAFGAHHMHYRLDRKIATGLNPGRVVFTGVAHYGDTNGYAGTATVAYAPHEQVPLLIDSVTGETIQAETLFGPVVVGSTDTERRHEIEVAVAKAFAKI